METFLTVVSQLHAAVVPVKSDLWAYLKEPEEAFFGAIAALLQVCAVFEKNSNFLGRTSSNHLTSCFYRDMGENGLFIEGSTFVSKKNLNKAIPYKYVIAQNQGSEEYEFIYKPQQREPVNRCLYIKSSLLASGDWHQYDGIVYMQPPGMRQQSLGGFKDEIKKSQEKGKQIAVRVMLDSIFSTLQAWDTVNLKSFLTQLRQFHVAAPQWTQMWSSSDKGESKVLRFTSVSSTSICRTSLVNLCQLCMNRRIDFWILTLPVLHHCVGLAPQGKDIPPEDTWAALEGLCFSEFREKRSGQNPFLLKLMEKHQRLLTVDDRLFRSWFSLLPLWDLSDYMRITAEYLSASPARFLECFQGVYYRLQGLQEISKSKHECFEKIFKMLLALLHANLNTALEGPVFQSYLTICLKLHETVCEITKSEKFYEIPVLSAEMISRIVALQPLVHTEEAQGSAPGQQPIRAVLQGALAATRHWLRQTFTKKMLQKPNILKKSFCYPEEIQVWRQLVEIHFPVDYGWKEVLLGDMEGRLKQEKPLLQISAYCSYNWGAPGLDGSVAKSFEKCAVEAVSSACQSQTSILDRISLRDLRKFGNLLSAVITESWPVTVDGMDEVLKHLLTGPDIKPIFKVLGSDEKTLANMTEDVKRLMGTADSVFTKVVGDLLSGQIFVRQLELLEKHKAQFLDIWEIKSKSLSPQEKEHDMKTVLKHRGNEHLFLNREKKCVDNLLQLCEAVKHLIKVDFGEIASKHLEDLSNKRLRDVVAVRPITKSEMEPWYNLTTHYNLSREIREMAKNIDIVKASHIFKRFWEEAAKSLKEHKENSEKQILHLTDMHNDLYLPCYKRFTRLYQDLMSENVTFDEINTIFTDFINKYDDLTSEFKVMCNVNQHNHRNWVQERVEQIKEYHCLYQAAVAAKVILRVKENLGLTGDFSVLHTLLHLTEAFDSFRHENRDMNGVKVFVDLAAISAGENDKEVDRVACFHDAMQGYASVLYKLSKTAGFAEFMDHLRELWKALENDPNLPEKLRDSARNLEWLKTVKETHGSVELSSLSLATAINSRGVYVIEAPKDGPKISPDSVLHLDLPESLGDHGQARRYSLEELRELQNKLMLMSGKKEQNMVEVEVFAEVFCNVQRLVQSFLSLYSAGNMLFRTWSAQVYCSPKEGVSILMDFHLELVGQLTGCGEVAGLLEDLCRQMEHFLDHWKTLVAKKRAEYFHLNFYTAEQLVYLSTELKKPRPSEAALMMLSFIKGNCTWLDVLEVSRRTDESASRHRGRTVKAELLRILSSEPSLAGKSLYVKTLHRKLEMQFDGTKVPLKIIRLMEPQVDEGQVLDALLPFLDAQCQKCPTIFHIDVTSSVQSGIWEFLFKLLILQYLMDVNGKMWLRNQCHLYVIEILEGTPVLPNRSSKQGTRAPQFSFLDIFPKVTCRPPKEVMEMRLGPESSQRAPGMDHSEFCSETFQRPYQYIKRFHQHHNLDTFQYQEGFTEDTPEECLQHFLFYCGVMNPSWSELRNFARFLNYQLKDCEASVFCNPDLTGDTLRGFKNFVVTFLICMARDFATPTLNTSDQSPGNHTVTMDGVKEEDLAPFTLRKRWESEPHPYVFFNGDHVSMTFIGFHLKINQNGTHLDAVNHLNGEVIKKDVMKNILYVGLLHQNVPFNVDFDRLPRHEKLEKLCMALGIQWATDPDDTYELTTDNMLKILAIEMRFRCGIPVVIMGETGCGKTRLIKFLSDLRRGGVDAETLKLVKVHGGTTADMIYSKVREAEHIAVFNKREYQLDTILFLDEANTTEAISCIKEVLCDHTVNGEPLAKDSGLHIIAACNPYRKHSQEMISRLESAGLGYRVRAEETTEKLGSIPLRQLVYRVHALPPSMIPLVWDFGQLNGVSEKLYTQQIVQRLVDSIEIDHNETRLITEVLSASQGFMRTRGNECSFVSLRDVERCVKVFKWFYDHSEMLFSELDSFLCAPSVTKTKSQRNPVLWALVQAIGVCYHASLERKELYRRAICRCLPEPYNDSKVILEEMTQIQDLFLNGVPLRKTIAKNLALKENFFMMVICTELKIPLFLVGKPGSSKSLAKTIVADAMQGQESYSVLFRNLKQVHLVSFQCSPHSTPQGIIATFKQCARFQQGKDLDQYVSVVVLDEVGLAEDSPKMPLKTLHPLLEDGCIEEDPAPHKKVGFIGISNWALDPAKMNRGLFVSRGSPSEKELIESAKGICHSDTLIQDRVQEYFAPFAKAYDTVCQRQDKEFFGLRDYYSLIKMVFAMAKASHEKPSSQDVAQAILRNFSGKDDIKPLPIFMANLPEAKCSEEASTLQLIRQNIYWDHPKGSGGELEDGDCRYLLVLTKNYVALQILQQTFFSKDQQQPEIIFGSGFPKDQEYTQICRNINRVKICMETGKMVVLLNLQNLYESLYDALNQYYVYLGGQKYVDLGLGTHRVKCRVHPDFRLIVIEEKDVVYRQFPIPLINRLEKHYLDINTVLEKQQRTTVEELKGWVEKFIQVKADPFIVRHKYSPPEVFIGYHSDACASVVLQVTERRGHEDLPGDLYHTVLEEAKLILLGCATPDAVVRLSTCSLGAFAAQSLSQEYYYKQQHNSFADFLQAQLRVVDLEHRAIFTEITTFSRLLTSHDCGAFELELEGRALRPTILSLQQFDTEYSFLKEVRNCVTNTARCRILIIQTDFEDRTHSAQLIASAKYSVINEINKIQEKKSSILVYFITKLSRMGSRTFYVGFQGGLWQCLHIDDLHRSATMVSEVTELQHVSISQLFAPQNRPEVEMGHGTGDHEEEEAMETELKGPGDTAELGMDTDSSAEVEGAASGPRSTEVLDTSRLLSSCVQSAVGMLRDHNERFPRNTRRVAILLGLLNEEDGFRGMKQEETMYNEKEWVVREASNQDALQEAGTFRHTLWKRIQKAVTPQLASMISIIDRDGNLELLINPDFPSWAKDLWMFIFSDIKLLHIPNMKNNIRSQSEMSHIVVQNNMKLSDNSVPFSWRIKDYLEELWVQAQYITDAEGLSEKLVAIFQQTPLGRFLARLGGEQQQTLLQWYLKDFLLLTMRVSTEQELQFLQLALGSCMGQLRALAARPEDEVSLPWVHLAYQHFRSRLQNFSRILAVCPQILDSLTEAVESRRLPEYEMTLDALAAMACVELLTRDALQPTPQAWLQTVKDLSTPLELLCSEVHMQGSGNVTTALVRELRTQWNRIFSISLFVEHVLLGTQSQIPELHSLVMDCTASLNKCLQENSDIKTYRPFAAVMTTLCECKERASKTLTRVGVQPCPKCLGDAQDPVCLPCDHIYCHECIRTCLIPEQMRCPLCSFDLPDNFPLTVSQEQRDAVEKHSRFRHMCNSFFVDVVSTMCFKDNTPPQRDVIEALLSLLFVQKELLREAPQRHCEHTKSLSPFDDVVDKTPVIRSVVLKLLLKYSFREVKDYLQDYLSSLEKIVFIGEDKTELYTLFINCLEDSIHEKTAAFSENEELNYLQEEGHFLRTCFPSRHGPEPAKEASIEYLQEMARVRLCLDRASDFLFELHTGSEMAEEKQHYLQHVEHFCSRAKNDADSPGQLDRFLVYGDGYKTLRDAVGRAILECNPKGMAAALETCREPEIQHEVYLLLALFQEVTVLYRSHNASLHPKPEQCEAVNRFIEDTKPFSPEVGCFATALVANTLPLLTTDSHEGGPEAAVAEMAVHAAAILLCVQNKVLEPLRNLAFFPAHMANAFLPTMPDDLLAQARNWGGLTGVRWYTCSQGHPCAVGECGMPMQQSYCIDCGLPVGGVNHRPHEGFHVITGVELTASLRTTPVVSGEIKLPNDYCSTDLDLDTPFEVILPRRRGRGLCSTALVSYLIRLHNEMAYTVEKFSKDNDSYSIDASEVTELHVISYETERDLVPLILSNCQYRVEQGGEALQEFDLEKIQRQVMSRFLQGKPRLTLKGLPTLIYRQDWNYGHLFMEIKNKISQSTLPYSVLSALRGQLQSFSDACEALSVTEVTLGFLSTAGGDPNMPLKEYIQDVLRMRDQTSPALQALSGCRLKHVTALWWFLSAHKCEQLLRQGKDPFKDISSQYKVPLRPEAEKLLSTFLHHTDLEAFLLELHEMMILKLKSPRAEEDFNPAWSLKDAFYEMESQCPEDILLSSCVSVWNMAAKLKQDRDRGWEELLNSASQLHTM
ncbi:E3 ubiquitin-protein ligase RNF213-like [Echinops telfairi]|uniref:E3 ubiquitin-protein ligase RNF213-like n=1 Tax=Echinops telfairi TaxID=9371 RepID=A0AC55DUN4_ECHTE|nr:E3 ubiquitin-protein ligase RNF213-like [Echinops telfairi]